MIDLLTSGADGKDGRLQNVKRKEKKKKGTDSVHVRRSLNFSSTAKIHCSWRKSGDYLPMLP
jgi:hypothetical protein